MNKPAPRGRTTRTPVSTRNILSVKGKEDGYEYRIVNDQADRIQMFEEAGYEKVLASDVIVGDKRVNNPSPEGSYAVVSVGKGDKAYVMRQKKEWYQEDQANKEAALRQKEKSIETNASKEMGYGTVKINAPSS